MSDKQAGALDVFVSYAHEDEALCDELRKQLVVLERKGRIRSWHDRSIGPGEDWGGEIDYRLNAADLILMLISPDFMASDYISRVEVPRAMARHKSRGACVVPIILRPVEWSDAPFAEVQSLPTDARPVTTWPNRDEAFLNIQRGLRKVIARESKRRGLAAKTSTSSRGAARAAPPAAPPPADRSPASSAKSADSGRREADRQGASGQARPASGAAAPAMKPMWAAGAALAVLIVLGGMWALRDEPRAEIPRSGLITRLSAPRDYGMARELEVRKTIEVYDDRYDGSLSEVKQDRERIIGHWLAGTFIECGDHVGANVDGGGWLKCRRLDR